MPVKHKIFLSGTPIKNNAVEYFPCLNLLQPELFPARKAYIDRHVDFYWSGRTMKAAGLRDPEGFKELTKDFIIRRTRKEVEIDLPEIVRDYQYYEMQEGVQKAYDAGVKKLDKFLERESQSSKTFKQELQQHMMVLYHITGLSKVEPIINHIEEFLESSENGEKLAIFHHHIDVGDVFEKKFQEMGIPSLRITSKLSAIEREEIAQVKFRHDPEIRFLIAPSLASGEGIDLEFCEKGILCEREWNPANEEQVEGRFTRATPEVVKRGKKSFIVTYPVAIGTVDEFFAELVERKRQYINESLDGARAIQTWDESEVMLEIAKRAVKELKNVTY